MENVKGQGCVYVCYVLIS